MAGLPMIFLRFGALSRMVLLRTLSTPKKLTQRELDWVYRLENVQYGWEFPTQLLVVVIVFTYAIMCPVILPFGLIYFLGALVVYKKQILYVYSPVYESGGTLFPLAVQRSLFGLVCGQMTFLAYMTTKGSKYQPLAMLPLPIITIWVMQHFHEAYVVPSTRLSLERAREYDIKSNTRAEKTEQFDDNVPNSEYGIESRRRSFNKDSYRQPVLTQRPTKPWMYRRGQEDDETILVRRQLRRISRLSRADRNNRGSIHASQRQQTSPQVFVV
jgi:Calcium-dependent channel, 7TM region, putative phosphate